MKIEIKINLLKYSVLNQYAMKMLKKYEFTIDSVNVLK